MLEIVAKIWRAEQRRQIVFASHNANLVVSGDSELVAWCHCRAMGDQSHGHDRQHRCDRHARGPRGYQKIMEGGEAAFTLRREKYGF
jgi:type III restriction enzyme